MAYHITDACINCGACVSECPVVLNSTKSMQMLVSIVVLVPVFVRLMLLRHN